MVEALARPSLFSLDVALLASSRMKSPEAVGLEALGRSLANSNGACPP
jgi:hypothetical protein